MRKIGLVLLCTIFTAGSALAQQTMTASGEVVSVRNFARTMTVRDSSANEVIRYAVPRDVEVTFAGQPGRLGFLRAGDTVNLNYTNTNDGRQATRIRVPQPTSAMDQRRSEGEFSTITGTVERVDARNRTLTVLGDQSGQRFTYALPEGARITVGGETARVGQLQRGDAVVLRFSGESDQRQAARVRVPRPATPLAQRTPPAGVAGQQARTQLPRTASNLPMLTLLGAFALLLAGAVRMYRTRAQ
jgi:hypothetical protein